MALIQGCHTWPCLLHFRRPFYARACARLRCQCCSSFLIPAWAPWLEDASVTAPVPCWHYSPHAPWQWITSLPSSDPVMDFCQPQPWVPWEQVSLVIQMFRLWSCLITVPQEACLPQDQCPGYILCKMGSKKDTSP